MTMRLRAACFCLTAACFFAAAAGCGTIPALPDLLDVATSATDRVAAAPGTGPASLADSAWSILRKADPLLSAASAAVVSPSSGPYGGLLGGAALERPAVGDRVFVVRFGPNGEMVEVDENRFFLPEIYGGRVPVGGQWTGALLPGVAFQSASYGVQVGDRFGLAVVVNVRGGELFLGQATLYAWGTVVDGRIDGTFGYLIDFTGGVVPFLGTVADQYPIEAVPAAP